MNQPLDRLSQLWLKLEADELAHDEAGELVERLRDDPAARQVLVEQAGLSAALAAAPGTPPPDLQARGTGGGGGPLVWFSVVLLLVAGVLGWSWWHDRVAEPSAPVALAFNFGPENLLAERRVAGMRHDIHGRYDEERGYGWLDDLERRYRTGRVPADQPLEYASVVYVGDAEHTSTFAVRVDNGVYLVQVVVGRARQGPHRVVVEGERLIDGAVTTGDRPFITVERLIMVSDGRLDVELGTDDGPAGVATKDIDTGLVSLRIRSQPVQ